MAVFYYQFGSNNNYLYYNLKQFLLTIRYTNTIKDQLIMSMSEKFYQCICCVSKPKYPDPYNFHFQGNGSVVENSKTFQSNFVKTSKYTWYNFLPLSLLLQFRRIANVYFLFIAILQSIPLISPLLNATAWVPLSVVLTVSIIRQGYEDYQRYKSDQQINHQYKTNIRRNGKFQEVQWKSVVVGDICLVKQDQLFPTDMILLTSSNDGGVAYIQTASLDGQKNLKPRNANKFTIQYANNDLLNSLVGKVEGSIPCKNLHQFSSNIIIGKETIVYEGDKQLLYRGSRLKNTKWIYGLTIYTGKNTKIMMNSELSGQKMSQIQIKVNRVLVFIFCFQIILCLTIAISFGLFMNRNESKLQNIYKINFHPVADCVFIFFSYFILINSMIPISLIVSMQIVKMFQSYFIIKDKLMYSEYRRKSASVKSVSLNQQLGQIQYIFTDKTGTLTMNQMQFKIAMIGNRIYGDSSLLGKKFKNFQLSKVQNSANVNQNNQNNEKNKFNDYNLRNILRDINNFEFQQPLEIKGSPSMKIVNQKELCQQFLFALASAHQVIAEYNQQSQKSYHGPSPDQITLVDAARQMGYQFVKSNQSTITIKINNQFKEFELLNVFPFSSDRKRMSVIIKSNGIIKMYTKGADNIIKQRLAKDNKFNLDADIDNFSKIGLRTLLVSMRIISQQQYTNFKRQVQKLPHVNRERLYQELISKLQKNLYILGATAVLDRLQDFVPQTIRDLIRANIKVWMLTGDKMETAQNIARSCNLFQKQFHILKLISHQKNKNIAVLNELLQQSQMFKQRNIGQGLLIQGSDLSTILHDQQGEAAFVNLVQNCQTVVCCRLNPSQKADVVKLVRKRLNKITLAIGDGANDVQMIKAAHIGIGLFGQQGMNAVQASDYALPQFRMLWRLLFVHGRWNYIRISQMILYFFFKNMLFTIPQFALGFFCGFSGQSMYDDWYIAFYNLLFTSVPLIVRAVLEQDVNYIVQVKNQQPRQTSKTMVKSSKYNQIIERQLKYLPPNHRINRNLYVMFPKIYFIGQENCIFNYLNFFSWLLQAIVEGVLITILTVLILGKNSLNQYGHSSSFWMVGLTTYSSVICIVTFKICSHTRFYSKLFVFSVTFLSLALYLSYMWISNYYFTINIEGTTFVAWQTPKTYLTVLFCICVVLFLDGIVVHLDFINGGFSSKMRKIIDKKQQQNQDIYDQMGIQFTELKTENTHEVINAGIDLKIRPQQS